jgi:hypothetical protein
VTGGLRIALLAFLHVHPESDATEGGDIRFQVDYPSAATGFSYSSSGRVRTASFTQETGVEHGH